VEGLWGKEEGGKRIPVGFEVGKGGGQEVGFPTCPLIKLKDYIFSIIFIP
jgi:hypothetical protein